MAESLQSEPTGTPDVDVWLTYLRDTIRPRLHALWLQAQNLPTETSALPPAPEAALPSLNERATSLGAQVYAIDLFLANLHPRPRSLQGKLAVLLTRDAFSPDRYKETLREVVVAADGWVVSALDLRDGRHRLMTVPLDARVPMMAQPLTVLLSAPGMQTLVDGLALDETTAATQPPTGIVPKEWPQVVTDAVAWDVVGARLERWLRLL